MGFWNNDSYNNENNKDSGSWYVDEPDNDIRPGADRDDPNNKLNGFDNGSGFDPDSDPNGNIHRIYIHVEPNAMLYTGSFILGLLTVATAIMGTVYLPFIFGGLAVVMAVVSRAEDGTMHFRARLGALIGALGIVLNVVIVGGAVYSVLNNPKQYEAFDSLFERIYGSNFESFLESNGLSGIDIPTLEK